MKEKITEADKLRKAVTMAEYEKHLKSLRADAKKLQPNRFIIIHMPTDNTLDAFISNGFKVEKTNTYESEFMYTISY